MNLHLFPIAMMVVLAINFYAIVRDAVQGAFGSSVYGIISVFLALLAFRYDWHWVALFFAFPTAFQTVCAAYLFRKVIAKDANVLATLLVEGKPTSPFYWLRWVVFHTSCLALLIAAFFRP